MTVRTQEPRSSRRPRTEEGRPAAFASILALAAMIVMWVLLTGPSMPVAVAIAAVGVVLALVALGWRIAGPEIRG